VQEIIKAIILGIIQGLTEFLPVSSSGHLELAKYFLGAGFDAEESLLMSVVLHIGTALSTVYVFRKEIYSLFVGILKPGYNEDKVFLVKIIVSMIPAGLVGFFLESQLEALFSGQVVLVALMLIVTGILLLTSDYMPKKDNSVSYKNSFLIGIAQAVAILPGISRSGATISASLMLGIKKENAAFFSFIMVLPLIFGKMAKDIIDGAYIETTVSGSALIFGFVAAFITGVFACSWMIALVKRSKLRYFAYYCFAVSVISIVVFLVR
jgi:undecaprenyl-diphosphatase